MSRRRVRVTSSISDLAENSHKEYPGKTAKAARALKRDKKRKEQRRKNKSKKKPTPTSPEELRERQISNKAAFKAKMAKRAAELEKKRVEKLQIQQEWKNLFND